MTTLLSSDLRYFDAPETLDRFTAVWPDGSYLGMSEHPSHPQGFGQHGDGLDMSDTILAFLGKEIQFSDLPPDCQKAVNQDLEVPTL